MKIQFETRTHHKAGNGAGFSGRDSFMTRKTTRLPLIEAMTEQAQREYERSVRFYETYGDPFGDRQEGDIWEFHAWTICNGQPLRLQAFVKWGEDFDSALINPDRASLKTLFSGFSDPPYGIANDPQTFINEHFSIVKAL
jgi:hypothetical protein